MMKKKMLLILAMLGLSLFLQSASAVVINFDDQTLGASFAVGESFVATGVQINVTAFQPTSGGLASIQANGDAGSTGNEVWLNNANLEFVTNFGGCPSCGISLLFGNYGSNVSLGINGNILSEANFIDFHGANIDGALIYVVQTNNMGALLTVSGEINTFTIGGQSMALDTVLACESSIPEPATLTLLGLGGFLLVRKRRNS